MASDMNTGLMDQRGKNFRIDGDRLWDSLMEMAKIGPGVAGGNNRQTLTDEDAEGRRLYQAWCEAEGLEMGLDKMGTMFARREGTDPSLPPVMVGSHLDTSRPVENMTASRRAGRAGDIRTLNETGIKTRHPIEVVNWTNEEGTRFSPPMMASGVFAGVHTLDWAYGRTDAAGKTVGGELERIGWIGDEEVGARKLAAFFELHIEQGPILEDENIDIGVVTHGQGLNWLQVTLTGKEAHTGSTPMPKRVNAGLGMARITQLVDEIAWSHAPLAVGAVGHCDVYPNSRNIIPGKVVFTVDFRHPKQEVIDDMEARLRAGAAEICKEIGLEMDIEQAGKFDPVEFDDGCVGAIRRAAQRLGYSHRDIVSGAGHDACWINRVAPTAMIMCPCVDGLSHNEAEDITKDWATAGADVLFHAVVETAGIVDD
ncbi:MAG: Zn-dependent hydrolase [Alphaproteobacteria bacterium]|nr:MAG: Zn-dependent hydrolase [Alphaproteobacteria bacterium]